MSIWNSVSVTHLSAANARTLQNEVRYDGYVLELWCIIYLPFSHQHLLKGNLPYLLFTCKQGSSLFSMGVLFEYRWDSIGHSRPKRHILPVVKSRCCDISAWVDSKHRVFLEDSNFLTSECHPHWTHPCLLFIERERERARAAPES